MLLLKVDGLSVLVKKQLKSVSEEELTAWMDIVLEALHQNSMLSKQDLDDYTSYSDMVGSMFSSFGNLDDEDFKGYDV